MKRHLSRLLAVLVLVLPALSLADKSIPLIENDEHNAAAKAKKTTLVEGTTGTEVGTAAAPLRVNVTGTTTQPVSSTQLPSALGDQGGLKINTGLTSLASFTTNPTARGVVGTTFDARPYRSLLVVVNKTVQGAGAAPVVQWSIKPTTSGGTVYGSDAADPAAAMMSGQLTTATDSTWFFQWGLDCTTTTGLASTDLDFKCALAPVPLYGKVWFHLVSGTESAPTYQVDVYGRQ